MGAEFPCQLRQKLFDHGRCVRTAAANLHDEPFTCKALESFELVFLSLDHLRFAGPMYTYICLCCSQNHGPLWAIDSMMAPNFQGYQRYRELFMYIYIYMVPPPYPPKPTFYMNP